MFHEYLYVYTMFILEKEYEEVYTFFCSCPLISDNLQINIQNFDK